jgi:uncharacterized protein (UPF0332 family)
MATAPFDWSEFLRLATALSQNPDEASHRTSISRAYYSVFHAATIRAKRNGYAGRGHQSLWALYAKDADRQCRKLAQIANTMKVAREDADYSSAVPRVADRMAQQIADANDFIVRLTRLQPVLPQP